MELYDICDTWFVPCRWNEKFDFIDIRADSILLVTVWDQATIIDAATSLRLSRVSGESCWCPTL